ncbi:MAG: hypothetical protein EBZ67_14090 [Chitinophagia bacterium]|nr:hypothetical protein [Chitinophagia bacterium]
MYNLRQVSSGIHRGADWEEALHDADTAELYHFYQYWMLTSHFRFAQRAFARNQARRAARNPAPFDWEDPPARPLEPVTADYTVVFLGPLDCEALSCVCQEFWNAQNWERVVEWAYLDMPREDKLAWIRRRLRPRSIGHVLRDRYFRTIRHDEWSIRWEGPNGTMIDRDTAEAIAMAQAGLNIDLGFERATPEGPEYDTMVAQPVSTAAVPAIRDSSSKPKRVKTRDRSHKRVRFSLCPEVYERPCEVIRVGLTRSRYALRKSMARAHGKILGSPNSRATRTPADAILKANALRADVLADLHPCLGSPVPVVPRNG